MQLRLLNSHCRQLSVTVVDWETKRSHTSVFRGQWTLVCKCCGDSVITFCPEAWIMETCLTQKSIQRASASPYNGGLSVCRLTPYFLYLHWCIYVGRLRSHSCRFCPAFAKIYSWEASKFLAAQGSTQSHPVLYLGVKFLNKTTASKYHRWPSLSPDLRYKVQNHIISI